MFDRIIVLYLKPDICWILIFLNLALLMEKLSAICNHIGLKCKYTFITAPHTQTHILCID